MSKGEKTKALIIRQTANLFNTKGYDGTSMQDIIDATGIQKGGIYRHFESKEALAAAATTYAIQFRDAELRAIVMSNRPALERLLALGKNFLGLLADYPLLGGCPIMNTAIEADDKLPALREIAQKGMDDLREGIAYLVTSGIEAGEIRSFTNGDTVATILLSLVEGALMLSKLYDEPLHLQRALDHLEAYLESLQV